MKNKHIEIDVKKTKKLLKPWGKNFENALIIICIGMIVFSVSLYFRGFHNVDIVHNYADLVHQVNELNKELGGNTTIQVTSFDDASDTANDFVTRPLRDYYIIGLNQMEYAYFTGLIFTGILGLLLGRRL